MLTPVERYKSSNTKKSNGTDTQRGPLKRLPPPLSQNQQNNAAQTLPRLHTSAAVAGHVQHTEGSLS